jgi:hypothetical protein
MFPLRVLEGHQLTCAGWDPMDTYDSDGVRFWNCLSAGYGSRGMYLILFCYSVGVILCFVPLHYLTSDHVLTHTL